MKGTYLGEFQEIVLLTILILGEEAYGVSVQQELKSRTGRQISRGALHTAFVRLEEKGFINSVFGGATNERGGRRKKYYSLSKSGKQALVGAKNIRQELWNDVPEISFQNI